jgi:fructose-specific phosphotransferase system IIC component
MRDTSIITISQLKKFFMLSLGIGGFTMFLGIVFIAVMIIDDYNDWWLDVGFYGGLIGGFLAALIFYQAKKQAEAMGIRPS